MKKTISTLFVALLIAGGTSVNAQDTKVKTKKTATATAKEIKPTVSNSGVVTKKVNKIDPANPPADATKAKVATTTNSKAKKITKSQVKTAVAQPIVEPKKAKANRPQ